MLLLVIQCHSSRPTDFEKARQTRARSKNPVPSTWRVFRLTESQIRTWGASCCQNTQAFRGRTQPYSTPPHSLTIKPTNTELIINGKYNIKMSLITSINKITFAQYVGKKFCFFFCVCVWCQCGCVVNKAFFILWESWKECLLVCWRKTARALLCHLKRCQPLDLSLWWFYQDGQPGCWERQR